MVAMMVIAIHPALPAAAFVALMAGQSARPLNGTFNNVPVLHSNQPEEVEGPGILINTAPGFAYSEEAGQSLNNAEYTFQGAFGLHVHHKYFPPYRNTISANARRSELNLAAILINPSMQSVHIRFSSGAVRNSFEAPYLANNLMGVKPLGVRPWNTGPGDATAVQMLRGKLDSRLVDEITIPPSSRIVLFNTPLPALGIANALLKGSSDGPFHVAVVAVREPQSDADVINVLDAGRLAPGRVYLNRIADINSRRIFSRVGGVALGDSYQASINHDLDTQGPLHVPLTSTNRNNFGTRDIQVNALASRMVDSSLDNVGTYGVRFDVDLNLNGNGPYELALSHPSPNGGKDFTAFRGSIQIQTLDGQQEVHVGLRSGQSVSLTSLMLRPGVNNPVRVSLVYPADATPGHLLSVVSASQLARAQERERQLEIARAAASANQPPRSAPPPPAGLPLAEITPPPPVMRPPASLTPTAPTMPRRQPPLSTWEGSPPELPAINQNLPLPSDTIGPLAGQDQGVEEHYRRLVESQERRQRMFQQP
ncbi:MAG: DUF3370 family protein [Synechococcaceae cyanobacterium]